MLPGGGAMRARMRHRAVGRLTLQAHLRYHRRLSFCSGKDNKAESALAKAEPPFEQFTYLGSQHENFFR
ncbi:MAG: hypothetical protein ACJ8LG_11460 [Massilia sp.]